MTILPLSCICGKKIVIETDDVKFLKEVKEKWERKHRKCGNKKNEH